MSKKFMDLLKNDKKNINILGNENYIGEVFDSFLGKKNINILDNSKLKYFLISFESNIDINFIVDGEDTEIDIYCIFLGETTKKNIAKIMVNIKKSFCKVNIYTTTFLLNDSFVRLDAGIVVEKNINDIDGYLLEDNIILGDNIDIQTLPLLDIKSDNVKVSHGAKIHKLSNNELFYIQSKGLSFTNANKLIIKSYINGIFEHFEKNIEDKKILNNIKINLIKKILNI